MSVVVQVRKNCEYNIERYEQDSRRTKARIAEKREQDSRKTKARTHDVQIRDIDHILK